MSKEDAGKDITVKSVSVYLLSVSLLVLLLLLCGKLREVGKVSHVYRSIYSPEKKSDRQF